MIRSYLHFWADELGALVRLDVRMVNMVEKSRGAWEEVFSAGMSTVTAPQDMACFSEKSDGDEKQTTHGIHSVSLRRTSLNRETLTTELRDWNKSC